MQDRRSEPSANNSEQETNYRQGNNTETSTYFDERIQIPDADSVS